MKDIVNKVTGASPIPAYMHPETAKRLLRLSEYLNAGRRLRRQLDRINQRGMEGK